MMMFSKFGVLAILTLCFLVGQSVQEECVPQSVQNLHLALNHILIWTIWTYETCEVNEILIYIFHRNQPAEYAFSVKVNRADISFLDVCEEWVFVVVPVSGHTTGPQQRIVDKIPLRSNADLTLAYLNMQHNPDTQLTHLQWDLLDKRYGNCSLQYRVTVEEAGSPVIEDFYVDHLSIDLHFLSSCTAYQFGVRAINVPLPTIEGPLKTETFILPGRKQLAPHLLEADSTASDINLSLRLESEVRNPCPLRTLYIDGGAAISQTIALNDEDRNPVNVSIGNLEPSTNYDLKIYVSNTAGWSDPTAISISTKDATLDFPLKEKKED